MTSSDLQSTAPKTSQDRLRAGIPDSTPLTLFTIPKPFTGHTGIIQRNAINSWLQLTPFVEIVLVGDEPGVAETAASAGVHHVAAVQRNEHGTPLVNSAFSAVRRFSQSPVYCFCNCDVILTAGFVSAMETLMSDSRLEQFVAIGRRTEIDIEQEYDFDDPAVVENLANQAEQNGRAAALVCKEYFAFTRDVYETMPEFAVGRGNWDNWMVASAKRRGVPVVNASSVITAIHQNHDYAHTGAGRRSCYVTGPEARRNQELAGGRNIISGATASWTLDKRGARPVALAWANLDFWRDLPNFYRLLSGLAFSNR